MRIHESLRILHQSLKEHGQGLPFKNSIESFKARLKMLEEEGHSFLDGGAYWNACVPLRWREETLGLALYGTPKEVRDKARLVAEAKRLRSDIEEMFLNQAP